MLAKAYYGNEGDTDPQEILIKIDKLYNHLENLRLHNHNIANNTAVPQPATSFAVTKTIGKITSQPSLAKAYFRLYASYCKNKAFEIENEYRIALFPLFSKNGLSSAKMNYWILSSGVIRPYIKVGFRNIAGKTEIGPLPIKAITIGPAGNQQAVFDSVVHRIKYRKSLVWDYWKNRNDMDPADPFWENFISYVCGAVERFAHKNARSITRNELKSVSEKLWSIWCEENRVAFDKKPTDLEKRVIEKFKRTQPTLVRDSRSDRHMEILASISRDNYLTKEGIWIKKSQIAYVF